VTNQGNSSQALVLFGGPFQYSLTLGREYYSQQSEILDWLYQQGKGDTGIKEHPLEECVWAYEQLFGHQFIAFTTEEMMTHFQLVWLESNA
jgi:hypothetical protein